MVPAIRRPRFGLATAVVLALAFVGGALVPGILAIAAATPSSSISSIGSASATSDLPSWSSVPFAERSGYSVEYSAETTDVQPATGSLLVVVTFEPRNATRFFATPAGDRAPLTTAELADEFGLAPAQYSSVEEYFLAHGLAISHAWPDRLALTVSGPAGEVGAAFGTTLRSGSSEGRPVMFPASPPTLPPPIEPLVASTVGLSSGFDAFTEIAPSDPVPAVEDQGSTLITPDLARYIYGISGLYNVSGTFHSATGESIALLLWGYGYDPSDLSTFFSQDYPSTFPAPTIRAYPIDGAPSPGPGAGSDPCRASQELTLDMEWSGSMAPGATLDAVYAPETASPGCSPTDASMADALNQAVDLPVSAISMSFGTPDSASAGLAAAWQTAIAAAVQKGITLVAATGDLGGDAQANCQGGPSPQYPSTSPDVLAVGGSEVSVNYGPLGGITGFSEVAWSDSGGGYSTQYSAPSWQPGFTGRGVPDVAATAADNYLYWRGQADQAGGTSFGAPLWAGLITEMDVIHGSPFGLIAPRLYAIGNQESLPGSHEPTGLAGITSGANCVASAGPGWNAVTGWGSPRAVNLYEDLTATFVDLSVTTSPSTVAQGRSLTISGQLANASDGAPIPGVPVAVSLVSSTDLGPCTGTFGSVTVTTDAGGGLSTVLSVPACYLGSHAVAEVVVEADGYYGTNSTTVAVNLAGWFPALAPLTTYPYNVVTFVVVIAIAAGIGYAIGRRPPRLRTAPDPTAPGATAPGGTQSK